jgi:hypothetical protein
MNFLPEKKYGVPSHNLVKKMFCAKKVTKLPDLTVPIFQPLVLIKCRIQYTNWSGSGPGPGSPNWLETDLEHRFIFMQTKVVERKLKFCSQFKKLYFHLNQEKAQQVIDIVFVPYLLVKIIQYVNIPYLSLSCWCRVWVSFLFIILSRPESYFFRLCCGRIKAVLNPLS